MTKRAKILWALGGTVTALVALLVVAGVLGYRAFIRDVSRNTGPALAFTPECAHVTSSVCDIWTEFRHAHPFPYQTIAAKRIDDSHSVLVISEPPPHLTEAQINGVIRDIFGASTNIERLRWYIGADGFLEDVVFQISRALPKDPLDDPVIREGVAWLHRDLFGTAFGGDLELIGSARHDQRLAPNLRVSAAEVMSWLQQSSRRWSPVESPDIQGMTWAQVAATGLVATLLSDDHAQVLLTFPTRFLDDARLHQDALEQLRVPFRQFALASDAVFAGAWTQLGQTAILGRVRTQPYSVLPPLRFETFALLASESGDELDQSYERNTPFAGKLDRGDHRYRDWAPVYLSNSLIDTELGALLNITDQMLKSWSEAGHVEYLYFNYPKPSSLPFNGTALSSVLGTKYGSHSVLFNWNTSGAAVIVNHDDINLLVARQTGSLPVTYGADGKSKAEGGRDVLTYEDEAYDYFGKLQDPNLSRVVQYTTLYQTFRGIARAEKPALNDARAQPAVIAGRAKAMGVLAQAAVKLLDDVDANRIDKPRALVESLRRELTQFRGGFRGIANNQLGEMLVNRNSPITWQMRERQSAALAARVSRLRTEGEKLESDVAAFNQMVTSANNSTNALQRSILKRKIDEDRASITGRQAAYEADETAFKQEIESRHDPLQELTRQLSELAAYAADLEDVRSAFVKSTDVPPRGAIKTPSIVLSWNREEALKSVGGHNVKASALRFRASKEIDTVKVVDDGNGNLTLLYNPARATSIESNAAELARAVEHRGATESTTLLKLAEANAPVRSPRQALLLPAETPPSFGRLGVRPYETKTALTADLRTLVEQNECCVFLKRDPSGVTLAAEPFPTPPPTSRIVEIRDTPSLVDYVARRSKGTNERSMVFLDETQAHVDAIVESAGGGRGGNPGRRAIFATGEDPSPRGQTILESDFQGRSSRVTIFDTIEGSAKRLLQRVGLTMPASRWREAKTTRVSSAELQQLLTPLKWDVAADGSPTAVRVSFGATGGEPPTRLALIAGFTDGAAGAVQLQRAHADAQLAAADTGGSLAKYFATLRNDLNGLSKDQLRKLVMVIETDLGTTLMTRIERIADTNGV